MARRGAGTPFLLQLSLLLLLHLGYLKSRKAPLGPGGFYEM